MARRKSRKSTRRSSPKKTNVLNLAQSVILGNAVTSTLFNTNMYEFVTGRINGSYTPGAIGQSSQITLPELFGAGMGVTATGGYASAVPSAAVVSGYGGVSVGNFGSTVQDNLKTNFASGLTTLIVTPIAFKVISKLAAKPRREFNKLARTVGLPISM
jgi:hypothetical protein